MNTSTSPIYWDCLIRETRSKLYNIIRDIFPRRFLPANPPCLSLIIFTACRIFKLDTCHVCKVVSNAAFERSTMFQQLSPLTSLCIVLYLYLA